MPVYSGRDAYLDGAACIQSWQATEATTHQRHSSSCVAGATNVPPGIKNWSGQVNGLGAFPEAVLPGTLVEDALLVINNTGGSLKSLTGDIVFEQLTIDFNKETYAPISWQATFGAQGNLTEAASGAADSTVAEAPNGSALDIKIATVSLTQAIRTAQIVLRTPLTTYVDGGTTYRGEAGNLEADINFAVYESSLNVAAYAANALSRVQIYATATAYWDFSKIRFGGKSNFVVDRTTHNILGYTVNGQWNAVEGTTPGYITYYDGAAEHDLWGDSTP